MDVFVSHFVKEGKCESWRLLVKERIDKTARIKFPFSLNWPTVPMKFLSRDVHESSVCLSVPFVETPLPGWNGDFWLKSVLLILAYL